MYAVGAYYKYALSGGDNNLIARSNMTINYEQDAEPKLWVLEGNVDYKGENYTFWYEYDERDGDQNYEFYGEEPGEDFDFDLFEKSCQERLEKSYVIVKFLDTEVTA